MAVRPALLDLNLLTALLWPSHEHHAVVLKPRPVHPFSRHSRISARHSSTRNVGTKR